MKAVNLQWNGGTWVEGCSRIEQKGIVEYKEGCCGSYDKVMEWVKGNKKGLKERRKKDCVVLYFERHSREDAFEHLKWSNDLPQYLQKRNETIIMALNLCSIVGKYRMKLVILQNFVLLSAGFSNKAHWMAGARAGGHSLANGLSLRISKILYRICKIYTSNVPCHL